MKRNVSDRDDQQAAVERAVDDFGTSEEFSAFCSAFAATVLCRRELVAGDDRYRFLEVEIYCHGSHLFPDVFAHGDEQQLTAGSFYFHKQGSGYKGGSYKGMDYCFGNREKGLYGGLLLRTAVNVASGAIVCGPCKVVDAILASLKCDTIAAAVERFGVVGAHESLRMVETQERNVGQILRSARVGLSLKAKSFDLDVLKQWGSPLRYVVQPESISKHRHYLFLSLLAETEDQETAVRVSGSTKSAGANWAEAFARGKREKDSVRKYFSTKMSTADICATFGSYVALFQ